MFKGAGTSCPRMVELHACSEILQLELNFKDYILLQQNLRMLASVMTILITSVTKRVLFNNWQSLQPELHSIIFYEEFLLLISTLLIYPLQDGISLRYTTSL
jgi:hypothetical protein